VLGNWDYDMRFLRSEVRWPELRFWGEDQEGRRSG